MYTFTFFNNDVIDIYVHIYIAHKFPVGFQTRYQTLSRFNQRIFKPSYSVDVLQIAYGARDRNRVSYNVAMENFYAYHIILQGPKPNISKTVVA